MNLPKIEVRTLNNGYQLRFDGMKGIGYMYYSPEKLLEGFMLHIGLKMTEQLNVENMQDFIETAINWRDNEKCVKEIASLTSQLKAANSSLEAMKRRVKREDDV